MVVVTGRTVVLAGKAPYFTKGMEVYFHVKEKVIDPTSVDVPYYPALAVVVS